MATEMPQEGAHIPLEADAEFWERLKRAAGGVGTMPATPPTPRGFLGRLAVKGMQRMLFWYTDQIRTFQEASVGVHLAALERIHHLYEAVARHERVLNPSQPAGDGPDTALAGGIRAGTGILDQMIRSAPCDQNALDIFRGEWSSAMPAVRGFQAGPIPLFEDPRVHWAVCEAGGVANQRVLELGPLEGGHTYMLQNFGAASVTAIESNTRAFLKCLIVKNLFHLDRADFRCGDFVSFLRQQQAHFDFVLAVGVLYHVTNPAELLQLIARATDRVFIWTHYYDEAEVSKTAGLASRFVARKEVTQDGFRHTLHSFEYREALTLAFTGGTRSYACWMERDDILACLRHNGFNDVRVAFEQPDHPHGPAFSVLAMRS